MSLKNYAGDLKAFLTNRYFLILVVYGGLLMFGTSVFATLTGEYSFWILRETGNAAYRRCRIDRKWFGRCREAEFGRVCHESAEFCWISGTVRLAGVYGDTTGGLRSDGVGAEGVWAG